jgi:hypothetical protein
MTSIKTLSKSLVDAATQVVTQSEHSVLKIRDRLFLEGLKRFGVTDKNELNESQLKALHSWVQIKLSEAACGCDEDDMPGDAPYHKDGDETADKKKELDEGEDAKAAVAAELKKLGKTLGELSPEEKKDLFNRVDARVDAKTEASDCDIYEGVELDADEIATNGAVGVTDAEEQLPVHADVLRDSSPVDGKTELRLFVQFNTNTLPIIVPPVTLPGAPTLDALRDVVEALPFFCDVCERALAAAADLPHEQPQYNPESFVAEAVTLSQTDRLVIASVKRLMHVSDVSVVNSNTEYLVNISSETSTGNKITIRLEPSTKRLGKLNWAIHHSFPSEKDVTTSLAKSVPAQTSLPFDQGDVALSIRKLQELLRSVAPDL